jgi:biofilm PGA synthesis protein PgaA
MKPYFLIYIIFIIFSILITSWSSASYAAKNPDKLHREALELARAGGEKLDKALVMFEELVATYPKKSHIFYDYLVVLTWANQDSWALRELHKVNLEKAPAYLLETLGESANKLQQYDKAVEIYTAAAKNFPGRWKNKHNLALALSRLGEHQKAVQVLEELLVAYPEKTNVFYDYIVILNRAKKYTKVIQLIPKVTLETAPAYVLETLAETAEKTQDYDKAVKLYKIANRRFPDRWWNKYRLGLSLSRLGKHKEAVLLFEEVLKTHPKEQQIFFDYLVILVRAEQYAKVIKLIPKVDLQTAPAYVMETLGEATRKLRENQEAATIYQITSRRFPTRWWNQYQYALALHRQGKPQKALAVFKQVLKAHPNEKNIFYDYIAVLSSAGKYALVIEQRPKVDFETAPIYVLEAFADAASRLPRRLEEAIKIYQIALRRKPNCLSCKHKLAIAHSKLGQNKQAIRLFKEILAAHPHKLNILYDYIVVLNWADKPAKALALLPKINLQTVPAYVLESLGEAARKLRRFDESIKIYKIAARRFPKQVQIKYGYALALFGKGEVNQAIAVFQNLVTAYPNESKIFYDYLTVLSSAKKNTLVMKLLPRVDLEQAPAYVLDSLGEVASNIQRFDKAIEIYQVAVRRFPDRISSKYSLALALSRQGNNDKAIVLLEQILIAHPKELKIFYDYLIILTRAGKYEKVMSLKKQVNLEQAPAYVLETLGQAARLSRRFDEAVKIYRVAVRRFPKRLSTHYGLALTLSSQGKNQEAQRIFENLLAANPDNLNLFYDFLVILIRGNHKQQVMNLLPKVDFEKAPAYVLEALGDAARSLRDFNNSIKLYRASVRRFPKRLSSKLGLIYALTDAGYTRMALKLIKRLRVHQPQNLQVLFAYAYIHRARGEYVDALNIYEDMLLIAPDNKDVIYLRILTVADMGAPHRAVELAKQVPNLFTTQEWYRFLSARITMNLRWSGFAPEKESERFAETDLTLERLDNEQRFIYATGGQKNQRLINYLRFDRISALRNRSKMREILIEYQHLLKDKVDIPCYVLIPIGDAYIYLEEPEKSRDIYLETLNKCPKNFNARMSLFYAYIETEEWDKAFKTIDSLNAEQVEWRHSKSRKKVGENPRKLQTEMTATMARAYADRPDLAQKRLEEMLGIAPANTSIRQALATIYLWRGWPEKALEEYDITLAHEPEFTDAWIARTNALFDLARYPEVDKQIQSLVTRYPENKGVQKLQRDWDLYNRHALKIETSFTPGGTTQFGEDEWTVNTWLYSAPLKYRYKPFIHTFYASSSFPEGHDTYKRIGTGVEYTGTEFRLGGELSQSLIGKSDKGINLWGSWRLNDYWELGSRFESFSTNVGLRANFQGVTAKLYQLSAQYKAHESHNISLSLEGMNFTDGNNRLSVSGSLFQRLVSQPHYKLGSSLSLSTSHNSSNDVFYFSPLKDFRISLSLDNDWIVYRRYERQFSHRLTFSISNYWQQNFGSGYTGSINYQHDWKYSNAFEILYGVSYSRSIYDGVPENAFGFSASLNWRFK